VAQIHVRGRELDDVEALTELFNTPSVMAGTLQLPYRSVAWRRAQLADDANAYPLVAEIDGRVVGAAGLHTEPSPRRRHCAGIGLAVHEAYQGQGVGTALLVALLDLADNWLGLRRLELQVYTDNAAAVRLYEKFGFQIEGTARQFALRGGVYVDAYSMARLRS
jgi:putative acetyltransferase